MILANVYRTLAAAQKGLAPEGGAALHTSEIDLQ
jgi:hypothetical protein